MTVKTIIAALNAKIKYSKLKSIIEKGLTNYTWVIDPRDANEDGERFAFDKSYSIKWRIEDKANQLKAKEKLMSLGFSAEECELLLSRYSAEECLSRIKNLEESLDLVDSILPRELTKSTLYNRRTPNGYRINGYRKIFDYDEVVENVEDLATNPIPDDIEVPAKIRKKSHGIIAILRDTSGSVSSPPFDKNLRDITVSLIKIAKKFHYLVGVIDFHSQPELILDSKGNLFTDEYNIVLFDSMNLKHGFATCLNPAFRKLKEHLESENLEEENLNLFLITDGFVGEIDLEKMKLKNPKVKVTVFSPIPYESFYGEFKEFIEKFKAKVIEITENNRGELIAKTAKLF